MSDVPENVSDVLADTEWVLEERPTPPAPSAQQNDALPPDLQALIDQLTGQGGQSEDYAKVCDLTRPSPLDVPGDIARDEKSSAVEVFEGRLEVLRQRVPVLVAAYGLGRLVPPCWDKHLPLISVLSALEASHSSRFDPSAPGVAEVDFLRDLQVCRTELTYLTEGRGCITGEHLKWVSPVWIYDGIPEHLEHFHEYF